MINEPTTAMPTDQELEIWEFDLAKRIVRLGSDANKVIGGQMKDSLERFRSPPVIAGETSDGTG